MTGIYYVANPDDPDAPVLLHEYGGIRPGDRVTYENPAAPPLPGPLVVDEIWEFVDHGAGGWVAAILNKGEYEVNADHLRRVDPSGPDLKAGTRQALAARRQAVEDDRRRWEQGPSLDEALRRLPPLPPGWVTE
jgi:hypothetical protein